MEVDGNEWKQMEVDEATERSTSMITSMEVNEIT